MSERKLVIDVEQRRPGCVLIQAALGGDNHLVSSLFDATSWLVAPTPGMRLVSGTMEQWKAFAKEVNAAHPLPKLNEAGK